MRKKKRNLVSQGSSNIDLLYRLGPTGVVLSFLTSLVYAALLWSVAAHEMLLAWLLASGLVAAVRLYYANRYLKLLPPPPQQKRWETGFTLGAAASALIWGAAAIFFFPKVQPLYQMVSYMMITGMAASAVSTLAASPKVYRVYMLCSLVPLFARLVQVGSPLYLTLAFLLTAFGVVMVSVSQWVYDKLRESQQAKFGERYRTEVLEMLAKGAALPQVLNSIVIGVEEQDAEIVASIWLLDGVKNCMRFGAAPSLPGFYCQAIDGLQIGPTVGSCGAAMHTGKRFVAEDIRTHSNWEPFREISTRANLHSCWSEPIKSSSGAVLGAFALYHRVVSKPGIEDIRRVEIAAYLAGVAIERRRFEDEHELASMVYRNSSEGMVVTDAEERVIAVNKAFSCISGYGLDELIGKGLSFSARNTQDVKDYRQMINAVLDTGTWQGVLWNTRKSGERFASRVAVNSIYDGGGKLSRRVMLISDITEQKRSDELIWRQANYDPLIGLPNRRLFRDRLEQEVKKAHRAGLRMALLFLDLDRFKEINDSLGHDAGDLLLVEAAKRISSCVRESDTVARLGGDEFTVILSEIEDNNIIERVASAIIEQIAKPFHLGVEHVYISASIGITVYPDDSTGVDELLKNADLAMYAAKNAGRNRFSYFTSATQHDAQQRVQMIKDLRLALPGGQFDLYYQPIVDIRTGQMFKAEALLRWHHPTQGTVIPSQFIQCAEESGLINEIGDWVFHEVIRVAKCWSDLLGQDFQISFNVSPVQFRSVSTCANWLGYLAENEVSGRNLTIEITEGVLLEEDPRIFQLVQQFQNAGVSIAIDDFGTGYSSLSYLRKFDIDYLKIDQSFVRDLATDNSDRTLAETIVVMGHRLGLKVIAEGVETQQQHTILANAGCDYAQGYLFSKPIPEQEFEALLTLQTPVIDKT